MVEQYRSTNKLVRYQGSILFNRYSSRPHPYEGPPCKKAGVTPGRIYADGYLAREDAQKLSKANPVGFDVVPVELRVCGLTGHEHCTHTPEQHEKMGWTCDIWPLGGPCCIGFDAAMAESVDAPA